MSASFQDFMNNFQQHGIPGLPKPAFTSPGEIRTKAKKLSKSVFEQWNLLNAIIERHESTIQKRWMKKTKDQRKKILLAAWPNMEAVHRPDIQAYLRKLDKNKTAFMWPNINLEDLLKPKLLPLFLNSRGRNKPAAFAHADIAACRFGHITGILVPDFLNEYTMMFVGRHGPEEYGELISWDDHPDAFDWLHTQRGHHPGEGMEILEIQDRIYKFLVECSKIILHDIPVEQIVDLSIPIQLEPASISSNKGSEGIVSLADTAVEAPYRLPANLDLARLEAIVGSRLSAAEDHIWALREDPSYYANTFFDWKEHRQEIIPDIAGQIHPIFDPIREPIFREYILQNVCTTGFSELDIWGSLHDQIVKLRHMSETYAERIRPDDSLPEDFALAFYKLRRHLDNFSRGPIGVLKTAFVASPPVRGYYAREVPENNTSTKIVVSEKLGKTKDQSLASLQWCMMTLFDDKQLHLTGLDTVVDELGRLLENEPKGKEYISSLVAGQISDVSIISQCISQIELYLPWAATFEAEMAQRDEELERDYVNTQKEFQGYFRCRYTGTIATLGNPSGGSFQYPANKRKTRENTEAMRAAERHLDALWRAVDQELSSKNAMSTRFRQLLAKRELQRTPEWVEPAKGTIAKPEVLVKPMSELYIPVDKNTTSRDTLTSTAGKSKVKTRGTARATETTNEAEILEVHKPDAQPIFKVDKRALKAFKILFFAPNTSSLPGELAWTDFVHALCTTGFSAEKLYGSAWVFRPKQLNVDTSIQFHEPHPGGKIPFVIARGHGRRLNRSYGWHGGMFVLAN